MTPRDDDDDDDSIPASLVRPVSSLSSNSSEPGQVQTECAQVHCENVPLENSDRVLNQCDVMLNVSSSVREANRQSRTSDSVNSELSGWATVDGSQTNLGYTDSGSEGSLASTGWKWERSSMEPSFRRNSKSLIDKTKKFVRRSRDRLSLIEVGRNSDGPRQPRFLRLVDETDPKHRSSYIEQPVSSQPEMRPMSAIHGSIGRRSLRGPRTRTSLHGSSSYKTSEDSLRTSGGYDELIDWSWLDEAAASLNKEESPSQVSLEVPPSSEVPEVPPEVLEGSVSGSVRSSRADAECQTSSEHTDLDWTDVRVRASDRDADAEFSSRCRVAVSSGHAMLNKPHEDETAGPSRTATQPHPVNRTSLPSWLRASMRRVTHFNLDTPSDRPASAPAGRTPPSPPPEPTPVPDDTPDSLGYVSDSTDRQPSAGQRSSGRSDDERVWEGRSPLGPWPHRFSSFLALLGCTLGLFNISRFAVLSIHFGANFIVQFVILSIFLGIPLFSFHAALGQTLGAGPVDMWSISPVFQGIGIALLLAQALLGIYSVVGVSWMFVYFRDSFITKLETYRWAEPFKLYREDGDIPGQFNATLLGRLDQTVPDYLNGVVLERHGLASPASTFGNLKFQLTFNLAVIWMIVFVSLSKGLRSYGKVVYLFSLVPVLGIIVLSSKMLGLTPMRHGLFPHTDWNDFFFNTRSWVSAATEVTLTWNLLGAAAMQVTSHNKSTKRLWRDVAIVSFITLFVLILAAFLANTCHQILSLKYSYIPSSFEGMSSYTFLRPMGASLPQHYATPLRALPHASLVAGDRVGRANAIQDSGYQVVRLATELMPATLALLGAELLSPFWAVLFYFTLILFGIAQQLAIWHCVITGILAINTKALKSWETTITFFACAAGFVLGLPMTTELGVFVVYFLDYCMGGGWWVLAVTLAELFAVFMLRARPYTGEYIAQALFGKKMTCLTYWAVPMVTFAWNVIMPVAVLGVCIAVFRSGGYRDMWVWRSSPGRSGYWPHWARQVGVLIQLTPLLCIPVTAIIQTYRYLTTGPPDILDRLTNLYRPSSASSRPNTAGSQASRNTTTSPADTAPQGPPPPDPPPKYTPPPSYSTATGARIAKMLRQSFRRSMRRLQAAFDPPEPPPMEPPPPDYTSVLVEMNHDGATGHPYTAADVQNVLRSSFRRAGPPTIRSVSTAPTSLTNLSSYQHNSVLSAPTSLIHQSQDAASFIYQSQDSPSLIYQSQDSPSFICQSQDTPSLLYQSLEVATSRANAIGPPSVISSAPTSMIGLLGTSPTAPLSPATTLSSLNSP